MNINVSKIVLYVVLTVMAIYAGRGFVARYSNLMASDVDADPLALLETSSPPIDPGAAAPATNETATATGQNPTATPPPVEGAATNVIEPATNETVVASTPPAQRPPPEMLTKRDLDGVRSVDTSGIGWYAFALFGTLIGLGFLAAHDISTFLGQKTHKLLHNEDGEGIHSVAYDKAEEVWANGDHLEAIRLMREYLAKNPREVHVMARIAEIYEKDLGNYLAAALEYEELLKQKLPPERWGWAAIHLVNLYYGKLDKPAQGLALLWRLHREYGGTQAAAKARKRLNQIDPEFAVEQARLDREAAEAEAAPTEEAAEESTANEEEEAEAEAGYTRRSRPKPEPAWEGPVEEPVSNLPKGFRPKKR